MLFRNSLINKLLLFGLLAWCALPFNVAAQGGNGLLRNLPGDQLADKGQVQALALAPDGRLIVGSTEGVFLYDGVNWTLVETPSEVRSLAVGKDSVIYVGCQRSKAAFLVPDTLNGKLRSEPIPGLDKYEKLGTVEQILVDKSGSIILLSSRFLLRYDPKTRSLFRFAERDNYIYLGGFVHVDGTVYINEKSKAQFGLLKVQGDKLTQSRLFHANLSQQEIAFSSAHESGRRTVIGTTNGRLFFVEGEKITQFQQSATAEKLKRVGLRSGVQLSSSVLALGTATSGLWLVQNNGSLEQMQIVSTQSGLPDNQIFALLPDFNNGLWIAHERGLSRLNVDFPISDLSVYAGLDGSPTAMAVFNGVLYVGTTNGVFRATTAQGNAVGLASGQKGYELRLAAEKEVREQYKAEIDAEIKKRTRGVAKGTVKYRNTEKAIRKEYESVIKDKISQKLDEISAGGQDASGIFYQKLPSVIGKSKQFLTVEAQLLVVTSAGLYRVDGAEPTLLVKNLTINRIFANPLESIVYVADEQGIALYEYSVDSSSAKMEVRWREVTRIGGITERVTEVVRDNEGEIWFSGDASQVVRVPKLTADFTSEPPAKWGRKPIDPSYSREIRIRYLHGKPRFITRQGAYKYQNGAFVSDPLLNRFDPKSRFFDSPHGAIWVADGNHLFRVRFAESSRTTVDAEIAMLKQEPSNSTISAEQLRRMAMGRLAAVEKLLGIDTFRVTLSLAQPITELVASPDDANLIWLLSGTRVFRYQVGKEIKKAKVFVTAIRFIQSNQDTTYSPTAVPLNIKRSVEGLTFGFSAASYDVAGGIRYEYILEGKTEDWQPVTPAGESRISFPGLDAGKYTLRVRALDPFDQISAESAYSFEIPIPWYLAYWKQLTAAIVIGGLTILLLGFYWQRKRAAVREARLQAIIDAAQRNIRHLLYNILPRKIANQLEERIDKAVEENPEDFSFEKVDIPPLERIERVSVLFTDFKGFTSVASTLSAEELGKLLNENFTAFDRIIRGHRLEKIKTIGDAYMACGGLPEPNMTNPIDTVLAGLELQKYMRSWAENRKSVGLPYWECRLGINTGELQAGIIGKSKFAYDCWGDTVNTASRMESNGEVGKVNISATTYQYLQEYFVCTARGALEVKNRGAVEQYFVESIKPGLHLPGEPMLPNEKFWALVGQTMPVGIDMLDSDTQPQQLPKPKNGLPKTGVSPLTGLFGRQKQKQPDSV